MKTLSEIVLPTDQQPIATCTSYVFLHATTVSLVKLKFYIKNKKTVDLKLQQRISKKNSFPNKHINVDIWLKMKVEPTYIYRPCFNVDKTTLKQRWLNYVDSTSMNQHCFNVEIWLRMKVEPTYLYRRSFNVDKTTLKQCSYSYVDSMLMTQCCFNVGIRLKRKVESTHVHRCWENSIETTLSIERLRFTRKWLNNKAKLSFQV